MLKKRLGFCTRLRAFRRIWICPRAVVLKGSEIPNGCIVGVNAIVSKNTIKRMPFFDSKGEQQYFFHGQKFRQFAIRIFNKKDLMPTQRFRFEEVELNAPANPDKSLRVFYGNNYMSFPRNGLEHHGDEKGKLKYRSKEAGIDMVDIYNKLRKFYCEI